MRMKLSRAWWSSITASILILLFGYTGANKLMNQNVFQIQIYRATFSRVLTPFFSYGIPILELIVVILLIIPRTRLFSLRIALALLTVFTIYIIGMLLFNSNLPCKCGGVIEELDWKSHILFNILFIAISIKGIAAEKG